MTQVYDVQGSAKDGCTEGKRHPDARGLWMSRVNMFRTPVFGATSKQRRTRAHHTPDIADGPVDVIWYVHTVLQPAQCGLDT